MDANFNASALPVNHFSIKMQQANKMALCLMNPCTLANGMHAIDRSTGTGARGQLQAELAECMHGLLCRLRSEGADHPRTYQPCDS